MTEGSIFPQGGRTKEARTDLCLDVSDYVLLWNTRQASPFGEEELGEGSRGIVG